MGPALSGVELRGLEPAGKRLLAARTIAVLGASTKPERPAHYVPAYLRQQGFRIIPVNPLHHGQSLWGEPFRNQLPDIGEAVDIVDVFRHPGFLPHHVPEFLAMEPAPGLVWLQLGIRHDEVARALLDAGIDVIQDRCTLADHRMLARG